MQEHERIRHDVTTHHAMSNHITNHEREPKNECDYHKTFVSQRNITTHHDMSHTFHMRHICMPGDRTIKK